MPKKKLTRKEALALREKIADHLTGAIVAAHTIGADDGMIVAWAEQIIATGGCPECAYETVVGEPGPYDRHTCEDW